MSKRNKETDEDHLDYLTQRIEETQQSLCELTEDEVLLNPSELGKGDLIHIINQLVPFYVNHQSQSNIEKRELTKNLQKARFDIGQIEKQYKTQSQLLSFLTKPSNGEEESVSSIQPKKRKPRAMKGKTNFLGLDEAATVETETIDSPRIKTVKVGTPKQKNSRLGNVWNRLTGSTSSSPKQKDVGRILPFCSDDDQGSVGCECTYVMVGHSKPVVNLHADEEVLVSAAKDKTVKVWDLKADREMGEIRLNTVVSVLRYRNNLLYLAEGTKVHVYDVSISFDNPLTSLQEIKPVNFLHIDEKDRLYTVQEKTIKCYEDLSDLKGLRFQSPAEITAFSLMTTPTKVELVYGCRDHCVRKLVHDFEAGTATDLVTFDPPHLDTVTGVIATQDVIYSTGREQSIVKWSCSGERLAHISNVHSDWIINLTLMPRTGFLVTNSRDGSVKVWEGSTLTNVASINQVKEPDGICSIGANSTTLFTGAQTKNIKMWTLSS